MSVAGNLRISNKFLLTAPKNVLVLNPNCPRHVHLNHLINANQSNNNYQDPIKSKVAVMTGGITGIGYHIAEQLLKSDAEAVILASGNLQEMKSMTLELNKKYGKDRALYQPVNFSRKEDVLKLFKFAKARFNKIDLVINNANVTTGQNSIQDNVSGVVQGTFAGFEEMFAEGGTILNTAAILEQEPMSGLPLFNDTNNFLIQFTRNMGRNYFFKPTNVKIVGVCPCSSQDKLNEIEMMKTDMLREKVTFGDDKKKKYLNKFARYPLQNSEDIGKAIVTVLEEGDNGSVWIAEPGNIYKLKPVPLADVNPNELIDPKVEPPDSEVNEIFLRKKKIKKVPEDPTDYGCKKKKKPRKPLKKRDPMKPKGKGYVKKKDPCAKYKKKKGGKK